MVIEFVRNCCDSIPDASKYPDGVRYMFKEILELRVQHVCDHLAQIERVRLAYRKDRV